MHSSSSDRRASNSSQVLERIRSQWLKLESLPMSLRMLPNYKGLLEKKDLLSFRISSVNMTALVKTDHPQIAIV